MLKTVTLLKRRSDLSHEEFRAYWREVHGPLVLRIPGVRGYVQGRPVATRGAEPDYDGLAEVWYESARSRDDAFGSPEYQAVLDDERNFMGATTGDSIFITVEEERLL